MRGESGRPTLGPRTSGRLGRGGGRGRRAPPPWAGAAATSVPTRRQSPRRPRTPCRSAPPFAPRLLPKAGRRTGRALAARGLGFHICETGATGPPRRVGARGTRRTKPAFSAAAPRPTGPPPPAFTDEETEGPEGLVTRWGQRAREGQSRDRNPAGRHLSWPSPGAHSHRVTHTAGHEPWAPSEARAQKVLGRWICPQGQTCPPRPQGSW